MTKHVPTDLSGPMTARNLLRLNIQHFAEEPGGTNPPDGFFATLKDAFKANPHLQTEHKTAITNAVSDRFKSYDFDVDAAKAALAEKKQREQDKAEGKDSETQETKTLKEKLKKLEDKTKTLALESFAGDAAKAKLIKRLAADKVDGLKLNDEGELDKAELDGILGELRTEFPDLFPVLGTDQPPGEPNASTPPPGGQLPPDGTTIPPTRAPGSKQQLNDPPGNGPTDVEALMAATVKKLKDTNRI